MVTIAQNWRKWRDPRLIILVLANHDLNQVTWEQRVMAGDPKFITSQEVPPFPFADYARMLGLMGINVETPDQIAGALDQAIAARCPVVIEAHTDPEVPTLPPHITFEQAVHFSESLIRDSAAPSMIRGAFKEAVDSLLPHK